MYGIMQTEVEIAEDVFVNVTYSIEKAEPDVCIMSDYIEIHSNDWPMGLDMDEDELMDKLYTELYRMEGL